MCQNIISKGYGNPKELILGSIQLLIPTKVPKDYHWLAPFPNCCEIMGVPFQSTAAQEKPMLGECNSHSKAAAFSVAWCM